MEYLLKIHNEKWIRGSRNNNKINKRNVDNYSSFYKLFSDSSSFLIKRNISKTRLNKFISSQKLRTNCFIRNLFKSIHINNLLNAHKQDSKKSIVTMSSPDPQHPDPDTQGVVADNRNYTTDKPETNQYIGDLVHTLIERKGKFQFILIILLSLNSVIVGINHTITTFHIYVPNFFCRDNATQTCDVLVNGTECPNGYIFDETDDRSLVVEYSMVCNRSMLGPLINSLYFVGVTLGSLICSSLCDVYGRRKLVIICLYGQALMAFGQYCSASLIVFIAFRMLQGFFIQGLQTCSYTLAMEYCPARFRTIAATYWESNWAIGLGILGLAAYYIRNWRLLTLALTFPAIISLTYVWIFPESIVWLIAKGRREEALNILLKIATYNKQPDIVSNCNEQLVNVSKQSGWQMEMQEEQLLRTNSANENRVESISLKMIVQNKVIRKHLISMVCIWFSVTLSYYGILYYLPNLAGQRHLNFEIGALIELIAYVLAYFVLSRFGRRLPMSFYQYSNGLLILTIAMLAMMPDGSYGSGWLIFITLVAKGLAVSSFCGMFIYCSELLPTVCRGIGLGLCGCAARFGSLLAPQLMAMVTIWPQFIPLGIMAMLLLIAATVTLFLPETLNTILPNTLSEADNLWKKS